jgi:hypothetical protein
MGRVAVHDAQAPVLTTVRMRSTYDRFVYYIMERYAIRSRRLKGMPRAHWTQDPILATYRFTNVRRAWDRTTQWMVRHWHRPHGNDVLAGMGCAVARFFGHPDALAVMGHPATHHSWMAWTLYAKSVGRERRATGSQLFTGAYIVSGAGSVKGTPKHRHVIDRYLTPVAKSRLLNHTWASARTLHDELMAFDGWGHFMTQEVVLDCMFTHVLAKATDRADYAMPGPGALRGLARLQELGMMDNGRRYRMANAREAVNDMLVLRDRLCRYRHPFLSTMTAHDVEFNLCEFDKYERTLWNHSTPKTRFTPHEDRLS